jgi:DNA-directed RNA polymerase subunit RPC12/RpoP
MALQESPPSGRAPPPPGLKSRAPHPDCPKCSRRMTVKQVTPVLFASNIDDVIYGCEDCSTEVKRSVKRD